MFMTTPETRAKLGRAGRIAPMDDGSDPRPGTIV